VFDLPHFGHYAALEQARAAAAAAAAFAGVPSARVHLTAGACGDGDVAAYKGAAPVLAHWERCATLRHCRWVDDVLAVPAPWVPTVAFLDSIGCDAIAHDALPYADASGAAGGDGDCYGELKAAGRFLATQRTPGVSTTDLVARVLRRREALLEHLRAKGVPPEELALPAAAAGR
jgi:choline-phosphate cytidylyltransferase